MEEILSARQFIYANYPKWAEAIDNGYDIRGDEEDWLEMMEAYSSYRDKLAFRSLPDDFKLQLIQDELDRVRLSGVDISGIHDGYHTFAELYEFRKVYNAALFNSWGSHTYPRWDVHKSWRHHDGELCFGGGWFIVVADLSTGQISNHYREDDWDLFKIPEYPKAKYPFDGHDSKDVIDRLCGLYNR